MSGSYFVLGFVEGLTYPVTRPRYRRLMEPITTESKNPATVYGLSDDELVERVKDLARCERRASATLIRYLIEFDARELYLREGCSSLYTYCTQVLHLSEASAYNRIEAARAARRHPQILEMLETGDLTLTAVRLLAPHLTVENRVDLLMAARHKSKFEIQELIASTVPGAACSTHCDAILVTPLASDSCRLHVTLSRETYDKLLHAQRLLRHTHPNGDVGAILDRALTLLIDDVERRRFARVASPRPTVDDRAASGRHIPAAVRRDVWQRDEGRCAFVGREGRCRETVFLEFHHLVAYAAGGAATSDNIQLRCRAHNQYEARLFFGDTIVRERREVWDCGLARRATCSGTGAILAPHACSQA
jgi:5-methylcytosine-specific restriction endonuclease McrA